MFALFLQNEVRDMVESAEADNFLDALKVAASWVEKTKTGYQIVIKDLTGLTE